MALMTYQSRYRFEQAWRLLVFGAALTHITIGLTFFLAGNKLGGPVFESIDAVPNPVWGWWAVISGSLIFLRPARLAALVVTGLWYALWGACLIDGIVGAHGPFYAIPVYLFLIAAHFTFALIEFFLWRDRVAAAAAPGTRASGLTA
jgi:hypothetical protein